jgi:hypothetical protein
MSNEVSLDHARNKDVHTRSEVAVIPITLPTRLFSWAQSLQRSSPVPVSSGVCCWYFRNVPAAVPIYGCSMLDGCTLLYLGIAPEKVNKPSGSLLSCVSRNYRGSAAGSSLRRTLGILLEEKSGFPLLRGASGERSILTPAGERWLDDWMEMNVFVGWTAHPEPWMIEYELLLKLSLPLNISHNGHHPFNSALRRIRFDALQRARALPIENEQNQKR